LFDQGPQQTNDSQSKPEVIKKVPEDRVFGSQHDFDEIFGIEKILEEEKKPIVDCSVEILSQFKHDDLIIDV
jgi:hypothetical protein